MPEENDYLLTWILGGVSVVVAALAGVVATLYKSVENKNTVAIKILTNQVDHLQKLVDECEKEKTIVEHKLKEMSARIQELELQLSKRRQ